MLRKEGIYVGAGRIKSHTENQERSSRLIPFLMADFCLLFLVNLPLLLHFFLPRFINCVSAWIFTRVEQKWEFDFTF